MRIVWIVLLLRNRIVWIVLLLGTIAPWARAQGSFPWPEGKQVAVSLSFDDARTSQVDVGLDLFERFGAAVTFYVVPGAVERRLEGWRRAVAAGHEIGNHSLVHPCSGNFSFAREKAIEEYTLDRMREELAAANLRIEELLGVRPEVFAYPCGQTFVGRGTGTRSYVPIVAEMFLSGRGWLDESANDPSFVDLAQVLGMEMDGKTFDEVRTLVDGARAEGGWVVLAGHEIGDGGSQTTRSDMLEQLLRYADDPSSGIWLAPVGEVARYVLDHRDASR